MGGEIIRLSQKLHVAWRYLRRQLRRSSRVIRQIPLCSPIFAALHMPFLPKSGMVMGLALVNEIGPDHFQGEDSKISPCSLSSLSPCAMRIKSTPDKDCSISSGSQNPGNMDRGVANSGRPPRMRKNLKCYGCKPLRCGVIYYHNWAFVSTLNRFG